MLVVNSNLIPYENEPLAVPRQEVLNVEQDVNGISPDTLQARFNRNISVNQWQVMLLNQIMHFLQAETINNNVPVQRNLSLFSCKCTCRMHSTQFLADALEFRCCREVGPTLYQLTFDGSIEKIPSMTKHKDYIAITHPTVTKTIAPLL